MTSFVQSAFPALYWSNSGAPAVGYLLPPALQAPSTLDLAQSWSAYDGCYLVVAEAVPDDLASQENLARAMWALLAGTGMTGVRFVWLANPNDASGRLVGSTLAVTGAPDPGTARATIRDLALFELRNVSVAVPPGCTIAPSGEAGFAIDPPSDHDGPYMAVAAGSTILDVIQGEVAVPFSGAACGCLQFAVQLGVTGETADLDHLDVGLRTFFPQTFGEATVATSDGAPFFIDTLRYPIFSQAEVALSATIDPLDPLDPTRTSLAFNAGKAIASHYLTNLGAALSLTPCAGATLVFAERPAVSTLPSDTPLYLVPSGEFVLASAGSGEADLMCGFSGVEYLKLPAGTKATLRFLTGCDAFAPSYAAGELSPAGEGVAMLTGLASTSWGYVHLDGGAALTYCAQPDSSVLHSPPATADPLHEPCAPLSALTYLEVKSCTLPAEPSAPKASFPLLAYGGVAGERVGDHQALEATVIAPARRAAIAAIAGSNELPTGDPGALADAPEVIGTTAQGLLASFAPGYTSMSRLTLAVNADKSQLALQNIPSGSALWTALQSNQLFLVITDPASIESYIDPTSTKLTVEHWTFELDPSTWRPLTSTLPTFLIFKFCDKPMGELASQLSAWAQSEAFNHDPEAACGALSKFVTTSREHAADPDFAYFIESVLGDPAWNGIVALNCQTPIGDWPPQLQGLAAGIDPKELAGHHAGVHATPVQTTTDEHGDTALSLEPSSIFGLIHYESPALIPAGPASYDFKVLTLKSRVENSRVASFSSTISLQVNQLFGEPCTLKGSTNNNLLFQGVYQQAAGKGSYVFLNQDTSIFLMAAGGVASAVLNAVEVTRAQFVTVGQPQQTQQPHPLLGGEPPGAPVQTRFLMWGAIDFNALSAPIGTTGRSQLFDVLSFGSEMGQAPGSSGLAFTGLAVDMTVTPLGEELPAARQFAFDAQHLSFDLPGSKAREQSLYAAFPLQLTGFIQTEAASAPTDLGYAPISTPLQPGQLVAPWFALSLQLELGSLGAWAPSGSFVAGLLVAWSPTDTGEPNVFVGLHLPGMSGGQLQIGLEGPLDLTIKNVAFDVPSEGEYLLWLQSIALSFFSLSFPFSGRTDLLLFAKADSSGKRTLGWYAAYDKGSSSAGGKGGQKAMLAPRAPALSGGEPTRGRGGL